MVVAVQSLTLIKVIVASSEVGEDGAVAALRCRTGS
jgi:hypothetical protein